MGLWSFDCLECGHPMLMPQATNEINRWMSDVVVITEDNCLLAGEYGGYGDVNGREIGDGGGACYHRACWEIVGKPTTAERDSRSSGDQGWFFNDPVHDMPEPKTKEDIERGKLAEGNRLFGPVVEDCNPA